VAALTFLVTRAVAEGVRVSAIALGDQRGTGDFRAAGGGDCDCADDFYTFEGGMKA